jgi:restriction system protein
MTVWAVRTERQGERRAIDLSEGIVSVGWPELPDLSAVKSRNELKALVQEVHPGRGRRTIGFWLACLWSFLDHIVPRDVVVLVPKGYQEIAVGEATGGYHYRADLRRDARHTRPVKWLRADLSQGRCSEALRRGPQEHNCLHFGSGKTKKSDSF